MRITGRLLLVAFPVLAICTFFLVRKQLGGIAPASPISTVEIEEPPVFPSPRTAQVQPTVLAPEPNLDENTLPPGSAPEPSIYDPVTQPDAVDSEEVIPIPDLQQPPALLEFPDPATE